MNRKMFWLITGFYLINLNLVFSQSVKDSSNCAQGTDKVIQYRKISMEDYKDKVTGGWLGQAIGVLFGQDTEGKWLDEIVPFDLEDWYQFRPKQEVANKADSLLKTGVIEDKKKKREFLKPYINNKKNWEIWTPDKMSDQDDLYIEFLFLYSLMNNGLDVTAIEIAEDWVKYLDPNRIAGANKAAYLNFIKGIWPPWSGHPRNTTNYLSMRHSITEMDDAIDFQIESDLLGLISPGLPGVSNAWCDKVGHMMNYGDGVYAGMAMAAMYSEAFFESDPRKLAEYSLLAIPVESGYAKMVQDVLNLSQKYPNWQDAWKELQTKYRKYKEDGKYNVRAPYYPLLPGFDVKINGAYVYMGLLYGGGDFWKSMNISMRCGVDSDCNPSSVAGILGTIIGMKGIPKKWSILRDLPIENIAIKDIYANPIEWNDILNTTVEVGKWNILENGGYLDKDIFYIPHQMPISPPLEQTIWEKGK
jgi:ADP-ribosylglycohydrolase